MGTNNIINNVPDLVHNFLKSKCSDSKLTQEEMMRKYLGTSEVFIKEFQAWLDYKEIKESASVLLSVVKNVPTEQNETQS